MARHMRRYAQTCLAEWAPRFGFGHFIILVTEDPADKGTKSEVWATIHFDVDEEWMRVYLDEELETLSKGQVEHIILHELTHGLLYLADTGKYGKEVVCNRVASLIVGPEWGVREVHSAAETTEAAARKYFTADEKDALEPVIVQMVLRLPADERQAILALDYDNRSLRDVAEELGVEPSTVLRRRRKGVNRMRAQFRVTGEL